MKTFGIFKSALKSGELKSELEEFEKTVKDKAVHEKDALLLELGYALIPLVDKEHGAELLKHITRIRREVALDMGLDVPRIRIMDNIALEPNEYCFKIRGIEAGRSNIRLGYYMCMKSGATHEIEGEKTKDPAFGIDAIWVPESRKSEAEQAGYAVVDPPTIIANHLSQIIRINANKMKDENVMQNTQIR